jgi:hypothetical protein
MSGFAKLEARIDALLWLEDVLRAEERESISLQSLRAMGVLLSEARDLVRPDYAAEPEPEGPVEEPSEPEAEVHAILAARAAEVRSGTAEINDVSLDEVGRDDLNRLCDADGVPLEPAERWDAPTPAPAGVIRAWAQKQGISCPPVGLLGAKLLNTINDRRRMLRLRPFVQAAAGGEA